VILNIGLSPAWQQILLFDGVTTGKVNRARESFWCASGKVLNVGRALKSLNAEVMTVAPIGGPTGEQIRSEFQRDGIPACWIECENSTRVCTTLLD